MVGICFNPQRSATHGEAVAENAEVAKPSQPEDHGGDIDEEAAENHHQDVAERDQEVGDRHNAGQRTEEEGDTGGAEGGEEQAHVKD